MYNQKLIIMIVVVLFFVMVILLFMLPAIIQVIHFISGISEVSTHSFLFCLVVLVGGILLMRMLLNKVKSLRSEYESTKTSSRTESLN